MADGELVAVEPLALPIGVAARIDAGRRARRLPYIAVAGTCALGWAGYGAVQLAEFSGGSLAAGATVGGVVAVTGVSAAVARAVVGRRVGEVWRWRLSAALAGACAWVDVATVVGPASWALTAAGAVGWAAVSARWLAAHDPGRPAVDEEPPALDGDLGSVLARRWALTVGSRTGVVPGSMLTGRLDRPHAIEWTVTTVPGSTTFGRMFADRERIAAALSLPAARLIMERSDFDEGHAILTIVTRDALADGVPYRGPRYIEGRIPVALYADGTGQADFVAFEDGLGVRSGLVTGDPGSGKSALLESIGLGLRHAGTFHVLFGDGDPEGRSSELLLNDVAHWGAAGPQEVLAQLDAIEEELQVHGMLLGTLTPDPVRGMRPITDPATERPCRYWIPCEDYPAIYWILDELHRLTNDPWLKQQGPGGFTGRLEKVLRLCRKLGVAVCAGTQSLLAGDFGGSTQLRGYLQTRNCFALRNANRSESAVVGGLSISPSTLPAGGKGYAYSTGEGRLAMCRVAWSPDMHLWVPALPDHPLDTYSAAVLARHKPERPRDAAGMLAEKQARLAEWWAGVAPAVIEAPAKPGPVAWGSFVVPAPLAAVTPIRPQAPVPAVDPLDGMWDGPDLDALRPNQRAVYDALAAGNTAPKDVIEATGMRGPAVSKALAALAELGLAHNVTYGQWALGPASDEQLAAV